MVPTPGRTACTVGCGGWTQLTGVSAVVWLSNSLSCVWIYVFVVSNVNFFGRWFRCCLSLNQLVGAMAQVLCGAARTRTTQCTPHCNVCCRWTWFRTWATASCRWWRWRIRRFAFETDSVKRTTPLFSLCQAMRGLMRYDATSNVNQHK